MAVIFAEQTETGSIAWATNPGSATAVTTPVAGSWSTYALRGTSLGAFEALWSAAAGTFYGQFRVHQTQVSADSLIMYHRSPNAVGNFGFKTVVTDQLAVYRGDGATLLGTCSTIFDINRWYYVQYYVKIHDTVGEIKVFVDGVEETITWVTGTWNTQDTRGDAGAGGDTCSKSYLGSNGSASLTIDDWVINDTTGTDNTSYPGNIGIEALMPNAAGDNTGLTRGGADSGSNYGQVDERPPNDATDYVYDTVVDDYDIYNYPATQWTSVAAVVLPVRAQKNDAGAASIAHMLKIDTDASGTADELDTGADVPLSNSWAFHTKYYNRQPDNAGDTSWTAAKVNALQAGVKVR